MIFGGNFAPAGWAFCDGSVLPISENDALFALIGTTYGGDGQTTFGLPDLRGRVPVHIGTGYVLGQMGGVESVTLTTQQIPLHSHPPGANTAANQSGTANGVWAGGGANNFFVNAEPNGAMAPGAVGSRGGSQPHDNMVPFQVLSFCISLFGVFPPQN